FAVAHWSKNLDQGLIEILVLAFIAGFVLFRLYTTLGRRTGAERPAEPRPAPAQGELPPDRPAQAAPQESAIAGPASEGLMTIVRADPSFDSEHFVAGARSAYELIVNAFAKGERETLEGLLTPRVYDSYAAA